MNELAASRADEGADALPEGSTLVLTAEGWERTDYIEPGDDWRLVLDGSYVSPDGTMRTWLLVGPETG
jgi:hypothetical protein